MIVFAIDPGPHTGIFWSLPSGSFSSATLDFTIPSEYHPHRRLYHWLDDRVGQDDIIVCESFQFHKDKRDKEYLNYDAGEYVGVVKLFTQLHSIRCVMQAPAIKEQFWTDTKLKQIGLYPVLKDRHQRDAARHWLYYDAFTRGNQEWLHKLKD